MNSLGGNHIRVGTPALGGGFGPSANRRRRVAGANARRMGQAATQTTKNPRPLVVFGKAFERCGGPKLRARAFQPSTADDTGAIGQLHSDSPQSLEVRRFRHNRDGVTVINSSPGQRQLTTTDRRGR